MLSTYVVYGDLFFLLNFVLDFFLLWAAGRFLRLQAKVWRLFAASAFGAAYALGALFALPAVLYCLAAKVFCSLLLLLIAYPYRKAGKFLQLTAVFYLLSFAMGGTALGISALASGYGVNVNSPRGVSWICLLFSLFVVAFLARRGIRRLRQGWHKEDFKVDLEVFVMGRSCLLPALIDTGNDLLDPVSGSPVIVGEYAAMQDIFPQGVRKQVELCGIGDPAAILQNANYGGWEKRLRLVPFASLGQKHGLLLGFRPDAVKIKGGDGKVINDVIICLSDEPFFGDYRAIINPLALAEHYERGVSA